MYQHTLLAFQIILKRIFIMLSIIDYTLTTIIWNINEN
jgi:hypothetical protein